MDDARHYSGVDFERRALALLGGAYIASGVVQQRPGSVDTSQIDEALNNALQLVWGDIAPRIPERTAVGHDFTWPANVESLRLYEPIVPGDAVMNPPLPRPWVDLWRISDRTVATAEYTVDRAFDPNEFPGWSGPRWMYQHDRLWFSDVSQHRGPVRAYSLRLHYIASPIRIDRLSNEPRTDIPRELHELIAIDAALCLAMEINSTRVGILSQRRAQVQASAFASVGRSSRGHGSVNWTHGRTMRPTRP